MAYTELQDISNLDLKGFLQFPSIDTPLFYPGILFTLFIVFTLATFFSEVKREGRGNFISSLAIGGYISTVTATIFSLLELVQYEIVVITLVISLIFQVIYLFTKKE